jgi:hypothetical protein
MTAEEKRSPPDAVGALFVTDGPAFVDFDHTGAPSIVLTGSIGTRDEHCCYRTHVLYPSGARAYREAVYRWWSSTSFPALLRDGGTGRVLFGSSIDGFARTFGSANAVAPVQIFAFERGRFRNVTPAFPEVVRQQADHLWTRARGPLRAGKLMDAYPGVIAYLIDMSALRQSAAGWRNLRDACTARDCPEYLDDVRGTMRTIEFKSRANAKVSTK